MKNFAFPFTDETKHLGMNGMHLASSILNGLSFLLIIFLVCQKKNHNSHECPTPALKGTIHRTNKDVSEVDSDFGSLTGPDNTYIEPVSEPYADVQAPNVPVGSSSVVPPVHTTNRWYRKAAYWVANIFNSIRKHESIRSRLGQRPTAFQNDPIDEEAQRVVDPDGDGNENGANPTFETDPQCGENRENQEISTTSDPPHGYVPLHDYNGRMAGSDTY